MCRSLSTRAAWPAARIRGLAIGIVSEVSCLGGQWTLGIVRGMPGQSGLLSGRAAIVCDVLTRCLGTGGAGRWHLGAAPSGGSPTRGISVPGCAGRGLGELRVRRVRARLGSVCAARRPSRVCVCGCVCVCECGSGLPACMLACVPACMLACTMPTKHLAHLITTHCKPLNGVSGLMEATAVAQNEQLPASPAAEA